MNWFKASWSELRMNYHWQNWSFKESCLSIVQFTGLQGSIGVTRSYSSHCSYALLHCGGKGKQEVGKASACWSLWRGQQGSMLINGAIYIANHAAIVSRRLIQQRQYLVVVQGCIERCGLGWHKVYLWPLDSSRMHRFFLTLSHFPSFALLSCDTVSLCFRFRVLAQLHCNSSGFIRLHSRRACEVSKRPHAGHVCTHVRLDCPR